MTTRDPHAGLISTRRSRFYHTGMLTDEPLLEARLRDHRGSGFYAHMLVEDVGHILPWGRGIDEGFTAVVESAESNVADLIRTALPSPYWPARTLEDGLRHFVEQAARNVLLEPVAYEIDYLHDADSNEVAAFRLEPLPLRSFDVLDDQPIEYVPAAFAPDVTAEGLHYVRLDAERVIAIRLESAIEKEVHDALTLLAAADRQQKTPASMLERSQQTSTGFDFAAFKADTTRVLLAGTRTLGWTGRGLYSEGLLDPYAVWRHLQFLRFKITIREAVLAALSNVVARAGKAMNFQAKLTMQGLLTSADIDEAEANLEAGRVPLRDLLRVGI